MIIFGLNPIREALKAHPRKIRYIGVAKEHGGKLRQTVDEARDAGVAVRYLPPNQIDRLAGGKVHNGIVAEISEGQYVDLDEVLADERAEFVLILDEVTDPQNFGAIIRVADCFGADVIVIPEHQSAGITAATVKASAGATEWVPVAQVTNLSRTIDMLKEKGYWVYGAAAGGDPLTDVDFKGKVAVVMGSEGKGIRKNVLEHCDRQIAIPMRGHVDSLNVSAAAAVIAYEVRRQKGVE